MLREERLLPPIVCWDAACPSRLSLNETFSVKAAHPANQKSSPALHFYPFFCRHLWKAQRLCLMCASGLRRHCVQNMVSESFLEISQPVIFVFYQMAVKSELMTLKIPYRHILQSWSQKKKISLFWCPPKDLSWGALLGAGGISWHLAPNVIIFNAYTFDILPLMTQQIKNLPGMQETRDLGSIPGSGRSGEGNGSPLQYFAWRMAGGAWQCIVHGAAKKPTRLSN